MFLGLALSIALMAQAAAPAGDAAKADGIPTVAPVKAEKPKKPKMICEDEQSTDSFISKRVCRTPEQVEAARKASREKLDDTSDFLAACKGLQHGC